MERKTEKITSICSYVIWEVQLIPNTKILKLLHISLFFGNGTRFLKTKPTQRAMFCSLRINSMQTLRIITFITLPVGPKRAEETSGSECGLDFTAEPGWTEKNLSPHAHTSLRLHCFCLTHTWQGLALITEMIPCGFKTTLAWLAWRCSTPQEKTNTILVFMSHFKVL